MSESSNAEETIAEIEKCEEISNQSVVGEDFIEETNTDYFKNFSLYSVLFLPIISIQFYLSVLLLLFYAYRKKLFAKYLGNECKVSRNENELNRVEETESNTSVQSENCEDNTDRKMPLDGDSQQVTNDRNGIEGRETENDHEKSGESMIKNESLSNAHEIETLMNVITPDNDLEKFETRNIINESVESKIKEDVACKVNTLDDVQEIKPSTENVETASILTQQENLISINKDELNAQNEIRNSISISDKDSKEDAKDKSSKSESNKLSISELIPSEQEQISVSCLVDENKTEIQNEDPKMKAGTINNESNKEVCFLKDANRTLQETKNFKADTDSSNNVRERSNTQSKNMCSSQVEEYDSNGLIPSLTDSIERGETENTEEKPKELQNKDGSFRSVGVNPSQKDLSKYGTDGETLENLKEESNDQDYKEAVSNEEPDAQTTTSVSNDGMQKHLDVNSKENKQDSLPKGDEPNPPQEISVLRSLIVNKATEKAEKYSSKPTMKESNSNDQNGAMNLESGNVGTENVENISIENEESQPEVEKITFGKEKSLDEVEVLDITDKTDADSTFTNITETENKEVDGKNELDELSNKDEATKGISIFDDKKSACICEEVKEVSESCIRRENNEDQTSLGEFSLKNNPDCQEAFECSENSRENEQFKDSVEKETLSSEKSVFDSSSCANNSLKLIYGPLIFETNVVDGSKFAFKFRSVGKHSEINKKANRSCEITIKKF